MSKTVFLAVMLGIIAVAALISVPSLFHKKCPKCKAKNGLDAAQCKQCGAVFPADDREQKPGNRKVR